MGHPKRSIGSIPIASISFPINGLSRARRVTPVIVGVGMRLTPTHSFLKFAAGGCMKDIHEVLRQKQAKYAQLGKQIEMLQQAAEKLREVAPLLTDTDEDESTVLPELDDTQ